MRTLLACFVTALLAYRLGRVAAQQSAAHAHAVPPAAPEDDVQPTDPYLVANVEPVIDPSYLEAVRIATYTRSLGGT